MEGGEESMGRVEVERVEGGGGWKEEGGWEEEVTRRRISLAVEGFDPEEIGIEVILIFFVEQHIQNPPKSALGKSH